MARQNCDSYVDLEGKRKEHKVLSGSSKIVVVTALMKKEETVGKSHISASLLCQSAM